MFSNNSHARLPLGCNPSEKQKKLVTLPRCRYGVQLSAVDVERGLGCDVLVRRIKTTFFIGTSLWRAAISTATTSSSFERVLPMHC